MPTFRRVRPDEIVVVPATPGPLRDLPTGRGDDVDELLDELFGPDDGGGPGVADAVLATGGGAAVVTGVVVGSTAVLGLGIGAIVVGSMLPARSLWRRAQARRLGARRAAALDGGTPLRVSPGPVTDLVAAHRALFDRVAAHPEAVRTEERGAAHAALCDVAQVLAGGVPSDDRELLFVAERADAVRAVVAAIDRQREEDSRTARRARLEAHQELGAAAGSSADELRALARHRTEGHG